jgi:hypothetical protein
MFPLRGLDFTCVIILLMPPALHVMDWFFIIGSLRFLCGPQSIILTGVLQYASHAYAE